jgi:hypothetical protein
LRKQQCRQIIVPYRKIRGFRELRPRIISYAKSIARHSGGNHWQVIRTVTHRNRSVQGYSLTGCGRMQDCPFDGSIDDITL